MNLFACPYTGYFMMDIKVYLSSGLLHSFACGLSCSIFLLYDPISLLFHLLLISPTLILHNILDEERALTLKTCSLLILLEWIPLLVDFELLPSWLRWYIILLFHLSNSPSYLIMIYIYIYFFLICDTELTSFCHWIKDGSLPELVRKRYQSFDSEIGQKIEVILPSYYLWHLLLFWVAFCSLYTVLHLITGW